MSNPQITIGILAQDRAKGVLQGVDNKVKGTADKVEMQGNRMAASTQKTTNKIRGNFTTMATGIALAATSISALTTSFSILDKAATAVKAQSVSLARAQDTVTRSTTQLDAMTLNLAKKRESLSKKVAAGKISTKDLAIEEERLLNLEQKLSDQEAKLVTDRSNIEAITLRLRDAQVNLSDTYQNFFVNLGPQILFIGLGITTMLDQMGIKINAVRIKTLFLNAAMKLTFLTSPWGIAILVVTAAIAALAFNIGGVQDKVKELGKIILTFIDAHFKPLADAIRWFLNNVLKPLGGLFDTTLPDSVMNTQDAFTELQTQTNDNIKTTFDYDKELEKMQQQLEIEVPTAAAITVEGLDDVTDAQDNTTESLKGVQATIARNIELYGVMGRTAIEAGVVTAGSIEQAGKIITSAARGIDKELRQVITTLNFLRGQQTEVRKRGSLAGARGNTLAANARREEAKNIGNQIQSARARGLSLALAGGSAFSDIFREFETGSGGIRYVNTDDGKIGVTPSGTSFATRKRPGSLRTVQQAIDDNLGSFDRTRARELLGSSQKRFSSWKPEYQNISREQFFDLKTAQTGLDEILPRDTLIKAHKGEHAKITPGGSRRPLMISLMLDRETIATAIIDDIDALLVDRHAERLRVMRQKVIA